MSKYSDYTNSGVHKRKTRIVNNTLDETIFDLTYNENNEGNIDVYINGVLKSNGYTLDNNKITFDSGLQINDVIDIIELILN